LHTQSELIMKNTNIVIKKLIFISCLLFVVQAFSNEIQVNHQPLQHHNEDEGYKNTDKGFENKIDILALLWRYISEDRIDAIPSKAIPVKKLTTKQLEQLPRHVDSLIRFGHSTIYLNLSGERWLIDPVFSERVSPFSFIGPKRFHQPPISLDQLPKLQGVIISHDHYDHLDKDSIQQLNKITQVFIVPLGVNEHLKDWGISPSKIITLDWWQSFSMSDVTITSTPTQHFSGRGLFDKNDTLWSSYVIQSKNSKLYFSGDSGYFKGFKEIGDKLGPFDVTMMETGAYDKQWATIHMTPEETIQAHLDLKGKAILPIHNGTFDLAFHSWHEPLKRIHKLATKINMPILTPIMGQVININQSTQTYQWWIE